MLIPEAYGVIGEVIAPFPVGEFFDGVVGQRFLKLSGGLAAPRAGLLGPDPRMALLSDFARLAPTLTCHAAEPSGPPPPSEAVASPDAFRAKIDAFHAHGYTVRIPSLRSTSPGLERLLRALEVVLHAPVDAVAFWSRGDGKAPVHHDDEDLIVIQLVGKKRWFVSSEPSPLPNPWKTIPNGPERLNRPQAVEVGVGDLLYLPRGTTHAVESLSESVHVAIGFRRLTVREGLIAVLDHLSDLDAPLRADAAKHLAVSVRRNDFGDLQGRLTAAAAQLAAACASEGFVAQALQRRSARTIGDLPKLAPSAASVSLDTRLRHAPLAFSHVSANEANLDVSYPGGHLYIHRGAQQSVLFILETPEFRVGDIPGGLEGEVLLALVRQFLDVGFLQVAAP